jgi:hypothetical protein
MSFKELNLYYQYANCINETNNFYNKSLVTRFFNSDESSKLQLLSISLPEVNNLPYFSLINIIINIINSYSAQFSQSKFESLDIELIQNILYILSILIEILQLSYKELTDFYEQNLSDIQINFILKGIKLLFIENENTKPKPVLSASNIDKKAILNKLNENELIYSNQTFQDILNSILNI